MIRQIAIALILFIPHVAVAEGMRDPAQKVPMVNTPIERQDLADVLLAGHIKELGTVPSVSRLAMGWAQVAFENGNGKYSYNHNLGNIGPTEPGKPWYVSRLDGNYYKAFDTFEEAAATYWHIIKRCTGVLQRFDEGAAAVAAKQLRACGYFGADLKQYTNGMAALYWVGRELAKNSLTRYTIATAPTANAFSN